MIVKQIRLSQQAKDKLSRLKGKTGIKNWNILCRWALCYSLSEKTLPTDIDIPADSNLEMSWYTFGGEYSDIYEALVKAWCIEMDLPTDPATLTKYFYLNIERGISYLCGTGFIKNLDDLVALAIEE
ncbi:DNA sulfur modification protein DndE [Lachnospiraceae bacterium XBD2001]|nr:DNA sulfur modification protein DndE [Lachnospiraceae bacterium XBD2001]